MALYSQAFVFSLIALSSSGVLAASLKQNNHDSNEQEQHLNVKKVHIIFMNHLDAGFTDYIDNVINLYFTQYFTQAVQRAAELADGDYVETFRYTTHPWLVSMYLDCPKHLHLLPGDKVKCPSAEDVEVFTQAVKLGFITWHAGPMNMQYEFLDEALLAHAFNLTLSLDARFNITRKYRTLSQRDVPGMCSYNDPRFFNSSRLLLKTGEHTWGYHGLSDQINWSNTAFQAVKNSTEFKNNTLGWIAQRQFTYLAVDALSDHPLATNISREFDDLKPSKPDLIDYHSDTILLYKCSNGIQVGFDETTGSLNQLADPLKQIEWASDTNGLAKFHYNTYSQTDFDAMQKSYINDGWFDLGIDKPNITQNAHPESKVWEPTLVEFYRKKGDSDCDFYAHLKMKDEETATKYGAPSEIWVHYQVTDYKLDRMGIDVIVQWFDKPATRMPEGIFLSFEPALQEDYGWTMSKSGQMVDPMNVVLNGSQRLHAIDRGVTYTDKDGNGIEFTSKDVALASTITRTLPATALPLPLHKTDPITGVSYNLFNNLWNLNYVLWYPFTKGDEDFKARFSINLLHKKSKSWPKVSASQSYTEGNKFERL